MTTTPVPGVLNVCWPVNTEGLPGWDEYDEADQARAVSFAGQALRMLTGYRVGGCPVTVRPCRRPLHRKTWRPGWGSAGWEPALVAGAWINIGCGHTGGSCGCAGLAEVHLGVTVTAVTEVRLSGVVLPPESYRLDRGGILVRTDGALWPLTQNLAAPDTAPGTWSVTTQAGVEVDGMGARAAGILAMEYLLAMGDDQSCRLPSGVTQIVRPGITIDVVPGVFPGGKTGVLEVDSYVQRYNPNALTAPSTVYSVDVQRRRVESRRNAYVAPSDNIDGGSP